MCVEPGSLARSRQQRVILPVHYPGRVHRTNAIPAYPTRTSMDSHGNPVTLLTVDRRGEQGLYPPQAPAYIRGYPPLPQDHPLAPHRCGLEHRAYSPAHPFRRPKFSGRSFSKAACFSQYETMYQHYYFQGLSYPEQEGPAPPGLVARGPARGAFAPGGGGGLRFPPVLHMAPAAHLDSGSASSFSCYHGHRSVCSGYLADCPGSDSSSSSSGQCHCSSSDSVVDCTEVSNQGVYGSCSTFRSSLSSDYDPFIYRSRSPCRAGDLGGAGRGPFVHPEGSPPPPEEPPAAAAHGHGAGRGEPWPGPASPSGDQLSTCSLDMNYSSSSSLEHRGPTSSTSDVGLEAPGAAPDPRRTWTGSREGPSCACCCEPQPPAPEPGGGAAAGSTLLLGAPLWEGRGPAGVEPPGSSQGPYGLHPDHLPRTDGATPEGLPCCFYEETQVARGGGCYPEDCSVSVQYALAQEPPPSCPPGARALSQRIPIIPEDVDCDLGPPSDCLSPWGGTPGPSPPQPHRSRGAAREEERVLCRQPRAPPPPARPPDTQEPSAAAAEAAGESGWRAAGVGSSPPLLSPRSFSKGLRLSLITSGVTPQPSLPGVPGPPGPLPP